MDHIVITDGQFIRSLQDQIKSLRSELEQAKKEKDEIKDDIIRKNAPEIARINERFRQLEQENAALSKLSDKEEGK